MLHGCTSSALVQSQALSKHSAGRHPALFPSDVPQHAALSAKVSEGMSLAK